MSNQSSHSDGNVEAREVTAQEAARLWLEHFSTNGEPPVMTHSSLAELFRNAEAVMTHCQIAGASIRVAKMPNGPWFLMLVDESGAVARPEDVQ